MSTPAPEMIARLAEREASDQVKHAKAVRDAKPKFRPREMIIGFAFLVAFDLTIFEFRNAGWISKNVAEVAFVLAIPLISIAIQLQAMQRRLNAVSLLVLDWERDRGAPQPTLFK
jgi:hypothetical protein